MLIENKSVYFFDMGNTLLDFHQGMTDDEKDQVGLRYLKEALEMMQVKVSLESLNDNFLKPLNDYGILRLKTLKEVDVSPLLKQYGDFSKTEILNLIKAFYKAYKESIVINSNAQSLLAYLKSKGKRIGIISNCYLPGLVYQDIFKETGLDDYIDFYVFSYDVTYRKPRKEIFLEAIKKAGFPLEACLMVGDGLKPDILGAETIGLDSVWYNPYHRPQNHACRLLKGVIDDFEQLKNM